MRSWSITTHAGLSQVELEEVTALQRVCEAAEHLDLKLEPSRASHSASLNTVLARDGGELVGYAGVDMGLDTEICGMVRPRARGHGIGTALLDASLDIARSHQRDNVLVICEEASPVALAWMTRRGAAVAHAEHRMTSRIDSSKRPGPSAELRKASSQDVAIMTRLLAAGFEMGHEFVEATLRSDDSPHAGTFLAFEDGIVTGTVRITDADRRPMIYGFVVDPDMRGKGHGAAMLRAALALLAEWGFDDAGLEVETTNTPAVRLYERFGFRTITTYRYMRLAT